MYFLCTYTNYVAVPPFVFVCNDLVHAQNWVIFWQYKEVKQHVAQCRSYLDESASVRQVLQTVACQMQADNLQWKLRYTPEIESES